MLGIALSLAQNTLAHDAPPRPLEPAGLLLLHSLDHTHRKLDAAVFDAYEWPHDLSDEEIPERLLALNLERQPA